MRLKISISEVGISKFYTGSWDLNVPEFPVYGSEAQTVKASGENFFTPKPKQKPDFVQKIKAEYLVLNSFSKTVSIVELGQFRVVSNKKSIKYL